MNIGDSINTPQGKGKLAEIHGDGKVGVVKTKKGMVYVRLPDDEKPASEAEPSLEDES